MKVIVDRIEGDFAVVEAGETMYRLSTALCPGAKESDTIEISVIGKQSSGEEPHAIFERLRKNSRKNNPPRNQTKNKASTETPDPMTEDKNG